MKLLDLFHKASSASKLLSSLISKGLIEDDVEHFIKYDVRRIGLEPKISKSRVMKAYRLQKMVKCRHIYGPEVLKKGFITFRDNFPSKSRRILGEYSLAETGALRFDTYNRYEYTRDFLGPRLGIEEGKPMKHRDVTNVTPEMLGDMKSVQQFRVSEYRAFTDQVKYENAEHGRIIELRKKCLNKSFDSIFVPGNLLLDTVEKLDKKFKKAFYDGGVLELSVSDLIFIDLELLSNNSRSHRIAYKAWAELRNTLDIGENTDRLVYMDAPPSFSKLDDTLVKHMCSFLLSNDNRDMIVCKSRWGLNKDFRIVSLQETSDKFNITRERVRQIQEELENKFRISLPIPSSAIKKIIAPFPLEFACSNLPKLFKSFNENKDLFFNFIFMLCDMWDDFGASHKTHYPGNTVRRFHHLMY